MIKDRCDVCGSEKRTASVDAGYGSRDGFRKLIGFCPKCDPDMIIYQVDEPDGSGGCLFPVITGIIFIIIIWIIS